MNIPEKELQAFNKFLFSIGFNAIGAQEIIQRIRANKADLEDNNLYRRYLNQKK